MQVTEFQSVVWKYYAEHGRSLPWREANTTPYQILVSEIMLQQTQVSRVIEAYHVFLARFPTVQALAAAELADVLRVWLGLGYNRRAKYLWQAANRIVVDFDGLVPRNHTELVSLPGVGTNTAGAILVYAFNQPAAYIETNIRTVFLHHFFADESGVSDASILEKVQATLDPSKPREWYWALMDYGAFLKTSQPSSLHRAKAHIKQAKFAGSRRQLRGKVLQLLAQAPHSMKKLTTALNDERSEEVIAELLRDELITGDQKVLRLGGTLER